MESGRGMPRADEMRIGAKSKYINRHNIPIFEQYFPNMKLVTLDTGHWGTSAPLLDPPPSPRCLSFSTTLPISDESLRVVY